MNLCRKQIIYYIVLPCLLASILAFIIGFLSGYLPNKSNNDDKNVDVNLYKYYETLIKDIDNSYFEQLSNEMNAENIRGHLRYTFIDLRRVIRISFEFIFEIILVI